MLRLLATVYLEWDCHKFQEKALNAADLANRVRNKNNKILAHVVHGTEYKFS